MTDTIFITGLVTFSVRVVSESRIGMPARKNAASWREKFIRSARFNFCFVIWMPPKPFFSFTSLTCSARLESSLRARATLPASRMPVTFTPLASSATYLNCFTAVVLPYA